MPNLICPQCGHLYNSDKFTKCPNCKPKKTVTTKRITTRRGRRRR